MIFFGIACAIHWIYWRFETPCFRYSNCLISRQDCIDFYDNTGILKLLSSWKRISKSQTVHYQLTCYKCYTFLRHNSLVSELRHYGWQDCQQFRATDVDNVFCKIAMQRCSSMLRSSTKCFDSSLLSVRFDYWLRN